MKINQYKTNFIVDNYCYVSEINESQEEESKKIFPLDEALTDYHETFQFQAHAALASCVNNQSGIKGFLSQSLVHQGKTAYSKSDEYKAQNRNQVVASYMNLFSTTIVSNKNIAAFQKEEVVAIKPKSLGENQWDKVVSYARANLPLEGKLVEKDGFFYLKVDNEYIHTLFPMLELSEKGFKEPPYFRSKNSTGAHISVFYKDEYISPEEIGKTFHFELKQIVIVQVSKEASYAVLQVVSPELEELRKKYGLSPKLHNHEFHISLAKK